MFYNIWNANARPSISDTIKHGNKLLNIWKHEYDKWDLNWYLILKFSKFCLYIAVNMATARTLVIWFCTDKFLLINLFLNRQIQQKM